MKTWLIDVAWRLASKRFCPRWIKGLVIKWAFDAERVVMYHHTESDDMESRLVCEADRGDGLPVTPNGEDIDVTFGDNSKDIFKV